MYRCRYSVWGGICKGLAEWPDLALIPVFRHRVPEEAFEARFGPSVKAIGAIGVWRWWLISGWLVAGGPVGVGAAGRAAPPVDDGVLEGVELPGYGGGALVVGDDDQGGRLAGYFDGVVVVGDFFHLLAFFGGRGTEGSGMLMLVWWGIGVSTSQQPV